LAILIFEFLLSLFLKYLNYRNIHNKLPDELSGVYDAEKYAKSQQYLKTNTQFSLVSGFFSFTLIILMLVFNGFAILNNYVLSLTTSPEFATLIFFGILFIASDILNMPFSIYDTFVIEEKFGFNKTTKKLFISDKLKSHALTLLIGAPLFYLIVWIYGKTETNFWIYTWIVITAFSLFMMLFYSNLIVPLFNKQTKLPDGELKTEIENYAEKVNFKLTDIYQIDGSKRSAKANAYFTGLGAKKRIVLYDTLINQLSTNQIVAVLAHETGHYKKKHTLTGFLTGIFQTGLLLYIFSLVVNNPLLSNALGVEKANFHIGMLAFGLLYTPVSIITGLAMNHLSRKNEYQADTFAAQTYHAEDLIEGLKKLSVSNLSNLTPHWLVVFFNYSHPTLLQRIKNLEKVTIQDKG